jgi:hypothetical protein
LVEKDQWEKWLSNHTPTKQKHHRQGLWALRDRQHAGEQIDVSKKP